MFFHLSIFRKLCVSIFQLENTDDEDDDNYEKFNYPTQAHSHSFLKITAIIRLPLSYFFLIQTGIY